MIGDFDVWLIVNLIRDEYDLLEVTGK